jgi:hypothetical protein
MRLVILNRNPSKLMQGNTIVINKIIGTKDQGHTCLQPKNSCLDCLHLHALQSFTNHIHSTRINHRHKHTKQTNKHTKNKVPIKREALKERTKGQARLNGSLKNRKCAWKGKAWLALKRWL